MPNWFTEPRFDLNGKSTRDLFLRAIELVSAARAFIGVNAPRRPLKDPPNEAKAVILDIFRDKPAAVVFHATGQDRDKFLWAIDSQRLNTVLAGLHAAIQIGMDRRLPVAEWLARLSIDAQKRYMSGELELNRLVASGAVIPGSPEQAGDLEYKRHVARQAVIASLKQGASRQEVMENVDQIIDAARSYWQAA